MHRYYCLNINCPHYIFDEVLPFAGARNEPMHGVSIFLNNEGASHILSLLGVTISNDSIQRLYDRLEFKDDPDVKAVGVDDVSLKKDRTYCTVIYDMNNHHLIELLDGRKESQLESWLKDHKKVKTMVRDRDTAYAKAIREALPDCSQIADCFHLLQDLTDNLKNILKKSPNNIFNE